jgi:hypothetical protein
MNIESDTRTLTHHWGLPRLWLYRQGRPLHGNPRSSVVGPQLPYRLTLALPYSPLAGTLGLAPIPVAILVTLLALTGGYVAANELVKHWGPKTD